MMVSPVLFWIALIGGLGVVGYWVWHELVLRTGKPVSFGVERPDGVFEAIVATHCHIDKAGNLWLFSGWQQVGLIKADEWRFAERGLTPEQIDQRGM